MWKGFYSSITKTSPLSCLATYCIQQFPVPGKEGSHWNEKQNKTFTQINQKGKVFNVHVNFQSRNYTLVLNIMNLQCTIFPF